VRNRRDRGYPPGVLGLGVLGYVLAVAAAAMNAVAAVLQRKAERDEPTSRAFSVGLLLDVVRRPAWLTGIVAVVVSFAFEAVALTVSPVSVVQPLLVSELPMTLLLASIVFRRRIAARDWWSVAALAVGLAVFSFCLAPTGGRPLAAPLWAWIVGLTACLALSGVLTVAGSRTKGGRRAALLGLATGIGFGTTAVLVAATGAAATGGIVPMLLTWQTYALVVIGPLSFFLLQNTLQAGALVASQPGMTLSNPLLAMAWGLAVFGEHARGGGWVAGEVVGMALIAAGTFTLVRSPVLHSSAGA
jgi:drug/metabolite transporter (DMT)-like permease